MVLPLSPIQWPSLPLPRGAAGESRQNTQLHALANQWDKQNPQVAAAIRQYIDSNWKTPVPPQVQQAVALITGQPPAVAPAYQQSPVPGNVGASLPAAFGYTPPAGASQVWPDQPSLPAPTPQAIPDPNALPVGGKGGSFFNAPAPAGGNYNPPANQQGPGGYTNETTPGSIGLGGPPSPAAVANAAQRGNAAATQAGGARPGGGSTVSAGGPFSPTGGNPLTTPLADPVGSIDPNSTPGEAGYTAAQGGDQNALDAILASMLQKYGIDVRHPGLYTAGIVKTLAPYLNTFMKYAGLSDMQPTSGRLRGLADQFGNMIGGADTMGQIRGFAQQALPGLQGMLANPAGPLAQPANQQGILNDFLGMLTAGANPIQQGYQQGLLNNANLGYQIDQTVNGKQGDFLTYLRNNAARTPGSDLLAQIIGASR
jgi:hypothetical protein